MHLEKASLLERWIGNTEEDSCTENTEEDLSIGCHRGAACSERELCPKDWNEASSIPVVLSMPSRRFATGFDSWLEEAMRAKERIMHEINTASVEAPEVCTK